MIDEATLAEWERLAQDTHIMVAERSRMLDILAEVRALRARARVTRARPRAHALARARSGTRGSEPISMGGK